MLLWHSLSCSHLYSSSYVLWRKPVPVPHMSSWPWSRWSVPHLRQPNDWHHPSLSLSPSLPLWHVDDSPLNNLCSGRSMGFVREYWDYDIRNLVSATLKFIRFACKGIDDTFRVTCVQECFRMNAWMMILFLLLGIQASFEWEFVHMNRKHVTHVEPTWHATSYF